MTMITSEQKKQLRDDMVSKGIPEAKIANIEALNERMEKEEALTQFIISELPKTKRSSSLPQWLSTSEMIDADKEPSADININDKFGISELEVFVNCIAGSIVAHNKKAVEIAHGISDGKYFIAVRTE